MIIRRQSSSVYSVTTVASSRHPRAASSLAGFTRSARRVGKPESTRQPHLPTAKGTLTEHQRGHRRTPAITPIGNDPRTAPLGLDVPGEPPGSVLQLVGASCPRCRLCVTERHG